MKVRINHEDKLAEYWLTGSEIADASLLESLKAEFKEWKQKKYLPVIYESGKDSLEEDLAVLMKQNGEAIAKKNKDVA